MVPTYTYRKQIVAEAKTVLRDWWTISATVSPGMSPTASPSDPVGPLNWSAIIQAPARPPDDQLLENSRVGAATTVRKSLTPFRVGGPVVEALERTLAKCRTAGV